VAPPRRPEDPEGPAAWGFLRPTPPPPPSSLQCQLLYSGAIDRRGTGFSKLALGPRSGWRTPVCDPSAVPSATVPPCPPRNFPLAKFLSLGRSPRFFDCSSPFLCPGGRQCYDRSRSGYVHGFTGVTGAAAPTPSHRSDREPLIRRSPPLTTQTTCRGQLTIRESKKLETGLAARTHGPAEEMSANTTSF